MASEDKFSPQNGILQLANNFLQYIQFIRYTKLILSIEGLLFASAWVSAEEYKADASEAPKADAETTTGMISKAVFVDFEAFASEW